MKTRDELLELIKDSMILDWMQDHLECHFGQDSTVGEWKWRDDYPDKRDLRKAIYSEMLPKKTTSQAAGACTDCGGPVYHRPGSTFEFDHDCVPKKP